MQHDHDAWLQRNRWILAEERAKARAETADLETTEQLWRTSER